MVANADKQTIDRTISGHAGTADPGLAPTRLDPSSASLCEAQRGKVMLNTTQLTIVALFQFERVDNGGRKPERETVAPFCDRMDSP